MTYLRNLFYNDRFGFKVFEFLVEIKKNIVNKLEYTDNLR